jgi:hypothetical protein
MYNGSDSDCFAKNGNDFNAMRRILISPFPGSNPGHQAIDFIEESAFRRREQNEEAAFAARRWKLLGLDPYRREARACAGLAARVRHRGARRAPLDSLDVGLECSSYRARWLSANNLGLIREICPGWA